MLDNYLRQRAKQNGATVHNGLFMRMEQVRDASASPAVSLKPLTAADARSTACPILQQPVEMYLYHRVSVVGLYLITPCLPRYLPVCMIALEGWRHLVVDPTGGQRFLS